VNNHEHTWTMEADTTLPSPNPINGLWGVARANTAVGVSPETFLLLLHVSTNALQAP
jgi:hypothetical protein